jgi:transcriptional regulator with XRE-family HTH domain
MWRERIIETRKAKGITTKMMSEISRIPVETITRILNEKTDDPRISTVLALGEAVGLSPWELFAEPNALVAYQSLLTLQAEIDDLKAERDALAAENATLKSAAADANSKAADLKIENDRLSLTVAHKEEVIGLQKEIIRLQESKLDAPKTWIL